MSDPRFPHDRPDPAAPASRPEVSLPEGYADRYSGRPLPAGAGRDFAEAGRARQPTQADARDVTWVWTLYALILFAIPTLGVSAAVGLYGVLTRKAPIDPVLASHARFQKRTLVHAAIAAAIGLVLIVVSVGVIVLFAAALWTLVRGVSGLWRLRQNRPIANPDSWTI